MTDKKSERSARGGAGRGQGRKPLEEGAETVVVSVRMTAAQREKLLKLGGVAWVRQKIDRARVEE